MTTGHVIWQGPSLLTGDPILAIAIHKSENTKTGNMVQTYILRQDMHPLDATRTGADSAVCGSCNLRPIAGGSCYVRVGQGPAVVWKAWRRGSYPLCDDPAPLGAGRMVRLGAYGDPMAVPARIWQTLVSKAEGHTGYTHQWRSPGVEPVQRQAIAELCMASVETEAQAREAQAAGMRYFRIRLPQAAVQPREMVCPASDEAGKRLACSTCGACNGTADGRGNRASVVIVVHGQQSVKFATPTLFSSID